MSGGRCLLCTVNDRDALVEEVAAAVWEREGFRDWHRASMQWRSIYRGHAETMLSVLEERQRAAKA